MKMPAIKIITALLIAALLVLPACTNPISSSRPSNAKSVSVSPPLGAYLANPQGKSSEVLLRDVQVNKGISDKRYTFPSAGTVDVGEVILIVSGSIQNKHEENDEIAMWAEGYDETGRQIAWTLDAAHIVGQIGLHLETDETGKFTLHLNYSESVSRVSIYANNYPVAPP